MKRESRFYKCANFYSTKQVIRWLEELEFIGIEIFQTIFRKLDEIKSIEPNKEGYGERRFIIRSVKPSIIKSC